MYCCCEAKTHSKEILLFHSRIIRKQIGGWGCRQNAVFFFPFLPPVSEGDLREIKERFNGAQRFNYAAEMELVVFSRKLGLVYAGRLMSRSDDFTVASVYKRAPFAPSFSLPALAARPCSPSQDNYLRQ